MKTEVVTEVMTGLQVPESFVSLTGSGSLRDRKYIQDVLEVGPTMDRKYFQNLQEVDPMMDRKWVPEGQEVDS